MIGWVGGPVETPRKDDPQRTRSQWYARPNPAAQGIRLPERTMWRDTETAATDALRDLFRDLRSTARIKPLNRGS